MGNHFLFFIAFLFVGTGFAVDRQAAIVCFPTDAIIRDNCKELKALLARKECGIDAKNLHFIDGATTIDGVTTAMKTAGLDKLKHVPVFIVGHGSVPKRDAKTKVEIPAKNRVHQIEIEKGVSVETSKLLDGIRKTTGDPSVIFSACQSGAACTSKGCAGACGADEDVMMHLSDTMDLPTKAIAETFCNKNLYEKNKLSGTKIAESMCWNHLPLIAGTVVKDTAAAKDYLTKKSGDVASLRQNPEGKLVVDGAKLAAFDFDAFEKAPIRKDFYGSVVKKAGEAPLPFEMRKMKDGNVIVQIFNPYPTAVEGSEETESFEDALDKLKTASKGKTVRLTLDTPDMKRGFIDGNNPPPHPFEIRKFGEKKFRATLLENSQKACVDRIFEVWSNGKSIGMHNPMTLNLHEFEVHWEPTLISDEKKIDSSSALPRRRRDLLPGSEDPNHEVVL